ncbi:MAG: FAD-dependent oxidoreductase [Pseudomonadota bacterium]
MPDAATRLETPALAFGLQFADLYRREGIERIDALFLAHLAGADPALHAALTAARAEPEKAGKADYSRLITRAAPHLDAFVGELFGVTAELAALNARHAPAAAIYEVKRNFVQRKAAHHITPEQAAAENGPELERALAQRMGAPLTEASFCRAVSGWLAANDAESLALAERYAAWAVHTEAGRRRHRGDTVFRVPEKIDPQHRVPALAENAGGATTYRLPPERLRARSGFALTDPGMGPAAVLDQAHYCIWCHGQDKDSCSTGLRERKTGAFRVDAAGVTLAGCPLEEKISEMNHAKAHGASVGALAIVTVDNPLAAATGHRICNDCMKSCIYQKQDPVDIPQIETRVLKEVLALPWGFEIYGLLTRWSPLHLTRPVPRPASGYRVLVVGTGPAGFNLAHHLLNDGHRVVAIDGLKIEPLPAQLSGVTEDGRRVPFVPVRDVGALWEPLDERVMAGFGGVAEYGITVRWDKNFLKLVRLLLERREAFALIGGVRFGGTLTPQDALALGFDHIALAAGAGRPTFVPMENALAKGVRMASDFLMALQLTGAARRESIANLQVRLPAVVIGGGLTAIDAATEVLAYYPVQVEKFAARYETLAAEQGEAAVRADWSAEDAEIADEFLRHAAELRAERAAAAREGRAPRLQPLVESWGGATIAYRRGLRDAPSYRLNHEEVTHALEEGVRFLENATPAGVEADAAGWCRHLRLTLTDGTTRSLPARTVLVAAGTQPNTVLARELPGELPPLDGSHFQALDLDGHPVKPERSAKPATPHVLMRVFDDGRAMSFWGDLHPSFAGNVVKAMAGAKQGYPAVTRTLARRPPSAAAGGDLFARLNRELRPVVREVRRLAPAIVEVIVHAPAAARRFRPGQFYRLQNFESRAPVADGTLLAMEGLALTGAWVDTDAGLVSLITLEMGGSSDLCAWLQPGEPVVLMGPTGTPTEIPAGETVLLAGGGLGNAVLFSIGEALRANGCRVLYFAGYKRAADRYYADRIERAADVVVWCCDEGPGFMPARAQDRSFVGNIVAAMAAYGQGQLGAPAVPLGEVDRIIAIGSDRMMAAVARARHGELKPHLRPGHVAVGSINSPMQCMMKEVCGQCLQLQRDPVTGAESVVFSCFNQDQPLDRVGFDCLAARLGQNALQEKLTAAWIRRCLARLERSQGRAASA